MKTIDEIPYLNYPNPYLRRDDFVLLNGEWDFTFCNSSSIPTNFDQKIKVPFVYESELSGVHITKSFNSIWYQRKINIKEYNGSIILHFDGVDYKTTLFVNGIKVGEHFGGYTSFFFDISNFVHVGDNVISCHVEDSFNKSQLSGKQRRKPENYDCWYTQMTGIWKNVYLEYAEKNYIRNIKIKSNLNGDVNVEIDSSFICRRSLSIYFNNKLIESIDTDCNNATLKVKEPMLWSPDSPNIYDLEIVDGNNVISTSFGIREIRTDENGIYINNKKEYQRMILNQGYWKESLFTPPSTKHIYDDLISITKFGFNSIRMHQKIEFYTYYYLCDCLGIYTTAEIPSAYSFDKQMKEEIKNILPNVVNSLYNSPSLIVWFLFNESWGIGSIENNTEIQDFCGDVYDLCRSLDKTRLIVSNDGWNLIGKTDLVGFHEYEQNDELFFDKISTKNKFLTADNINNYGRIFANNQHYNMQPIFCTEFGGVSMDKDGWGYGEKANCDNYLTRISSLFKVINKLDYVSGFCYTQFTDVEQETNGLMKVDRSLKVDFDNIRRIVLGETYEN